MFDPYWWRIPGLPSPFLKSYLKDRSEWNADDWREYALFLEERGGVMALELTQTQLELTKQRLKSSRKTKPVKHIRGLYDLVLNMKTAKRGRPKSDSLPSEEYARLALEKMDDLKAQGKRATVEKALKAVCDDLSLSREEKKEIIQKRSIRNRISKLKKSY